MSIIKGPLLETVEVPSGCIEHNVKRNTIFLRGVPISLTAIARAQGINLSYLSKVFDGQRNPSLFFAYRIASALGITVDSLIECILERAEQVEANKLRLENEHLARIRKEDEENIARRNEGRPMVPPLPGTRAL